MRQHQLPLCPPRDTLGRGCACWAVEEVYTGARNQPIRVSWPSSALHRLGYIEADAKLSYLQHRGTSLEV